MTTWTDEVAANRGIAALRFALLVIALIEVPRGTFGAAADLFPAVLVAFGLYALALLVTSLRADGPTLPSNVQAVLDLAFLIALAYSSGGANSPLRFAFYVMPIVAAVRLSPALTAAWAAVAILGYVVVTVPHTPGRPVVDADVLLDEGLALAWVGGAAVLLSALVGRRERHLTEVSEGRRQLARQALELEARERRHLAEVLHDEVIQNVLVARQEVADLEHGVPGAGERAQHALDVTHRRLRDEVSAMHPVTLAHAGLAAALQQVGTETARRGGFELAMHVDPATPGPDDDLVLATARELLGNAAKHARAAHVRLDLRPVDGALRLVVDDDGRGFAPDRPAQALRAGHIGLAAVTERVRAVGGDVEVDARPGAGTRVTVTVPRSAA